MVVPTEPYATATADRSRSQIFRRRRRRRQWPALAALGDAPMTTDTIYYCGRTTSGRLRVCCPCVNRDSPSAHNGLAPARTAAGAAITRSCSEHRVYTARLRAAVTHTHTHITDTHCAPLAKRAHKQLRTTLAGSRHVHAKCCVHITRSLSFVRPSRYSAAQSPRTMFAPHFSRDCRHTIAAATVAHTDNGRK